MARVHEIAIASETGAFEKGIKSGVVKPTEDAEKALKALGDVNVGKDIDRDLDAAQKATRNLKDETKRAADAIEREFRDSYRKVKSSADDAADGSGRSMRRFADTAEEANDELKQNLGETFSSFRGDMEDLPQIAQDVFGGLAGSVGGLLPALGLAAGAAGIGLLINAFNTAGEESDEFKAKAAELAQAYIDATGKAAPAISDIADAMRELATTTEEGETSLADLKDMADKANVSYERIAEAYAGNTDGLNDLIAAQKKARDALTDEANALDLSTDAGQRRQQQIGEQREGLEGIIPILEESARKSEEAAKMEAAWFAAGGPEIDAKANYLSALNDSYDEAASSVEDFINKETGVFDVSAYLAAMEERSAALAAYRDNVASSGLSPEVLDFLNSQGVEAASSMLAGYMAAAPDVQGQLRGVWTQAASDASGSANLALSNGLQTGFTTQINADVDPALSSVSAFGQQTINTQADVGVGADTADAESSLKDVTRPREVMVKTRLDSSNVDGWTPPPKFLTTQVLGDTRQLEASIQRQQGRTITYNIEARRVGTGWPG